MENNLVIAAILLMSKPTRFRTVSGQAKDITYDKNCPRELVSGSKVVICPTKQQLAEFAGLEYDSKDAETQRVARNHPAYLASEAMHKLEALQNQMSRKMKATTIETPFDRIFPGSEEENVLKIFSEYRSEFEMWRDVFFTYYNDMVSFWVEVSTKKWGDEWGQLVSTHSPKLMDIATRFRFIAETRDVTLRSTKLKNEDFVSYFFDDLVNLVESWRLKTKGKIDKGQLSTLSRTISPKLERYEFLDKRVKPISKLANNAIETALAKLKTDAKNDFLGDSDLVEFEKVMQVLTSASSLHAIQLVSDVPVKVSATKEKPTRPVGVKLSANEAIKQQVLLDKFKVRATIKK